MAVPGGHNPAEDGAPYVVYYTLREKPRTMMENLSMMTMM